MKKLLVLSLIAINILTVKAQNMYYCTQDEVYVRTGPCSNYSIKRDDGFCEFKLHLNKYGWVKHLGKTRNGYSYVTFRFMGCEAGAFNLHFAEGWVPTRYLKKLRTKKCSKCNGRGYFNRTCKDFEGEPFEHPAGCNCWAYSCWHIGGGEDRKCCGKQHCNKCDGNGFIVLE